MKARTPDADALYQYESEALPCDEDRRRRILELKLAIQDGSYDEQEFLGSLVGKMNNPPPTPPSTIESD